MPLPVTCTQPLYAFTAALMPSNIVLLSPIVPIELGTIKLWMMLLQNKKHCAKNKGCCWIGKEVPKEKKKKGLCLTLEEERFSSGYEHLSKGCWGSEQSKGGWDSKPSAQGILLTKPLKCVASSYESSATSVDRCLVGMLFKVAASRHKPAHSEGPVGTPAMPEDCWRGSTLQGTRSEHGAGESLRFTGFGEVRCKTLS